MRCVIGFLVGICGAVAVLRVAPAHATRTAAPLTPAEARALVPKDSFRECDACPEMVVVPAGSPTMGSPEDEFGRFDDEAQREVTIAKPFAVGKLEVTFAEWDACVAASGCTHRPGDGGWGRGKRPVINVSWNDIAKEYLPWLSRKTGKAYRLLTEAEWEYAARSGTTTSYAFGDTISKSEAQFSDDSFGGAGKTVEAGSFQANSFGLHDMYGNVWEWVQDCHVNLLAEPPLDGSGDCPTHLLRGGSWSDLPRLLRSAFRGWNSPDYRDDAVGFRVARTLTP